MNLFFSCNEGLENCMKTKRFSISHLFTEEKTHKIHLHDCYEIYYSISGGKQFFIDNQYIMYLPEICLLSISMKATISQP